MSSPANKAAPPSRESRELAISLIDAAYADGQISGDEHDERIRGVTAADSGWRLELWTHDLQRPQQPSSSTVGGRIRSAFDRIQRGWSRSWKDTKRELAGYSRRGKIAIATAVVAVTAPLAGLTIHELVNDDSAVVIDQTLSTGIAEFREAYEQKFGTTLVGHVQLDPGWTQVEVPVDGDLPRYETWYLQDGSFKQQRAAHGGRDVRIDLADIDIAAAERNLDTARTGLGVPDVSEVTVLVGQPIGGATPRITFVLRNEFDESARLVTDLAGTELEREVFANQSNGAS